MVTSLKERIIRAIDELTEEQQQKLWEMIKKLSGISERNLVLTLIRIETIFGLIAVLNVCQVLSYSKQFAKLVAL